MKIYNHLFECMCVFLCVCVAYRADIFVLRSIVLSPAHELWKCLEVTKHGLQPRDTFIELWDVMGVCVSVCACVCVPFTVVLMKRPTSPLSPHPHISSSSPSQPLLFVPFSNPQLCHNKTAAVWMRFSQWQWLTRSRNHSHPGDTICIPTTR